MDAIFVPSFGRAGVRDEIVNGGVGVEAQSTLGIPAPILGQPKSDPEQEYNAQISG